MIFITGDLHGDWRRFSTSHFPEQSEMTKNDYVIVCGDFGLWHDCGSEQWWLDWLNDKPFTLLFVDGNHENFDRLYGNEFKVVDFKGGKAHQIRDSVFHLMRGYVFTLDGLKFFAFGGATSHDISDGIIDRRNYKSEDGFKQAIRRWKKQGKVFRVNHESWWEQELPTQEEMDFGLKTLKENDNRVDYIITHCCPQRAAALYSGGAFKPDILTQYFNKIDDMVSFHKWYFGHYHDDISIMDRYEMRYQNIERVV